MIAHRDTALERQFGCCCRKHMNSY